MDVQDGGGAGFEDFGAVGESAVVAVGPGVEVPVLLVVGPDPVSDELGLEGGSFGVEDDGAGGDEEPVEFFGVGGGLAAEPSFPLVLGEYCPELVASERGVIGLSPPVLDRLEEGAAFFQECGEVVAYTVLIDDVVVGGVVPGVEGGPDRLDLLVVGAGGPVAVVDSCVHGVIAPVMAGYLRVVGSGVHRKSKIVVCVAFSVLVGFVFVCGGGVRSWWPARAQGQRASWVVPVSQICQELVPLRVGTVSEVSVMWPMGESALVAAHWVWEGSV